MSNTVYETRLRSFKKLKQGKVRDIYELDEKHLLIVATDRISAFDVVLPTPIPHKGRVLTEISNFWFEHFSNSIPNHLSQKAVDEIFGKNVIFTNNQTWNGIISRFSKSLRIP